MHVEMYDFSPRLPFLMVFAAVAAIASAAVPVAAQNSVSGPVRPDDPMVSTQWRLKPSTPTLSVQGPGEPAIATPKIETPTLPIAADGTPTLIGTTPAPAAPAPHVATTRPARKAMPPIAPPRYSAPITAPVAAAAQPRETTLAPSPAAVEPPRTELVRNPASADADIVPILGIAAITALAIAVGALAFVTGQRNRRERYHVVRGFEPIVADAVAEPAIPTEAPIAAAPEPAPEPTSTPAPRPAPAQLRAAPFIDRISTKIAARQVPIWKISVPTRPAPPPRQRAVRAVIQS